MKKTILFAIVLLGNISAFAQISTPAPSPSATLQQKVGLVDIKIEYSRPSTKGRKIFGETLPYGDLWRVGANASTKISFSDEVKIAGNALPKGTYSLYAIPNEKEWTVIINKNISLWGADGYKAEEDAFRITAIPQLMPTRIETFTIEVANIKNNSCDIELSWDNTKVSFPVMMDTDGKVMASIQKQMDGPAANDYFQAAVYYLEASKDLKTALEWANKAIEKGGEKFWVLRQKSLIQAGLGDKQGATATAERSLQLAKEANNKDYQRMNEKAIADWKKQQ